MFLVLCWVLGTGHQGNTRPLQLLSLRGGESAHHEEGTPRIAVVGSVNADIIVEVDRLPAAGEGIVSRGPCRIVAGGKGCNQAVASARLGRGGASFAGRFGSDAHGTMLAGTLAAEAVDLDKSLVVEGAPSGQGYVFLLRDGTVSSVVVSGANDAWLPLSPDDAKDIIGGAGMVLLQSEVPEHVNLAIAKAAAASGVPVMQDIGGEERPMSGELLACVTFVAPNLPELRRLSGMAVDTEEDIARAAQALQQRGAKNVLVTLGERGAMLFTESGGILKEPCAPVPGAVVDTTGAGDCFRAAFAVALTEGRAPLDCLRFASTASAIAVSRMGAVPCIPCREEVDVALGTSRPAVAFRAGGGLQLPADGECPLQFASRYVALVTGAGAGGGSRAPQRSPTASCTLPGSTP